MTALSTLKVGQTVAEQLVGSDQTMAVGEITRIYQDGTITFVEVGGGLDYPFAADGTPIAIWEDMPGIDLIVVA